jgi:hypothetical protein
MGVCSKITAALRVARDGVQRFEQMWRVQSDIDDLKRRVADLESRLHKDQEGPFTVRAYGSRPERKIKNFETHYTYKWAVEGDKLKTEITSFRAVADGEDATPRQGSGDVRTGIARIVWQGGQLQLNYEGVAFTGHPFGTWQRGKP